MLYYTVSVIASFILTILYLNRSHKYSGINLSNLFCLTSISNLGYYLVARSTDIGGALVATKMTYLGGCFLTLFTFQFIMMVCKIEKLKWVSTIAILFSSIVYALVITDEFHHGLYRSVRLLQRNGVSYMQKEYGPVHTIFYIMMIIFILLDIGVIIYGFRRKMNASVKSMAYLTALVSSNIVGFLLGKHIWEEIEIMPLAYIIDQIVCLIIDERSVMYNLQGVVSDALMERNALGYAAFDNRLSYLGSNEIMRNWFSEVERLRVDMKFDERSAMYQQIQQLTKQVDELGEVQLVFPYGDRFYKVKGNHLITAHNRKKGYSFFVEDNTEEQLRLNKAIYEKEHDAMTGLYNKGKYMELVNGTYKHLDSIAIFNMDVNNLKVMNDTYGHESGDALIIKAGNSIKKVQGARVKGFRLGGDEFMIVGENLSKDEALKLKANWEKAVKDLNAENDGVEIIVACGFAYGEKGYSLEELLKQADQAMYEDKKRLKRS